jgi:hypothetical protein
VKWSELVKKEAEVDVSVGEADFKVRYNPLAITAETEPILLALSRGEEPHANTANILDELILSWDVTEDDGTPMEPTLEVLRRTPSIVNSAITMAILDDLPNHGRPSRQNGQS